MQMSLYIHFPFCRSKCIYCDFCSFVADDRVIESYCGSLIQEIELAAREYPNASIQTVFFGGGTPSVVPARLMRRVTAKLHSCFTVSPNAEFTSEANPGTVSDAWLAVMAEAGMNRLSLGMQAKQDRMLKLLGRIHTYTQVRETLVKARKHGIANLSVDLMYGLPAQTLGAYLDSIRAAAALEVRHISAYALKAEENTKLKLMMEAGEVVLPDEDVTADMMESGIALLRSLGYERYEISNFAKPGFESQHNLSYWRQRYYLGLGLNAASMLPAQNAAYIRRMNTASLKEYQTMLSEGVLPVGDTSPAHREDAMFETIMLGLRTTKGVRYMDFEEMHGVKLTDRYTSAIAKLQERGWLQPANPSDPYLALNAKGLAVQNTALLFFMQA